MLEIRKGEHGNNVGNNILDGQYSICPKQLLWLGSILFSSFKVK